jgi:peptidyl-prolyl cis-trans isomerase D
MANSKSRTEASYKSPPELASALKAGFEIAPNDPPEIVSAGPNQGYVLVSPAQVVAAAPAPLANIRDRVASDWIDTQAAKRAKAVATAVAAKASRGVPLAQAMSEASGVLPPVRPLAARRIQIATAQGPVPAPLQMLFTLAQGKSRMIPDPEGRGFYVVKVNKIAPGNALLQPGLISRMQNELQETVAQDYAQEFVAALREEMKARRNEDAIRAMRTRMASSGG